MNPRHPLGSRHHRPSGEQSKGERHARQRASIFFEDEADPKTDHPDAESLNRTGLCFPGRGQVGKKPFSAISMFIEHAVVAGSVETDARCIDQAT